MTKPVKYISAEDGELIPVTMRADRITRIACCDCCLVHTHRVLIRFDKRGSMRAYLQSWRDDHETKRHRKNRRIRIR